MLEAYRGVKSRNDYWGRKEKEETRRRLVELYQKEGKPNEAAKYRGSFRD